MSKIKYKYNTKSLSYEKFETPLRTKVLRVLSYLATGTVFAVVTVSIAFAYIDSPKEKQLKREIEMLNSQLKQVNSRMDQVTTVLEDLQDRDNKIYRVIFEAEPVSDAIREGGFGGSDRYRDLMGYDNSKIAISTAQKMDNLVRKVYIQSKSFDEVVKLAKSKELMLASIPAIQPIANKDLKKMASGFGYRTHPIYKITRLHTGMDFTANVGTEIYATGNGVVTTADAESRGYGNHVVINHGYGYETLYGHMSSFNVKPGQKVKRGDVIGYVGNTGTSSGPHLHYEVIKNGEKIDPVNFYYSDLSPVEYAKMIQLSEAENQSFD